MSDEHWTHTDNDGDTGALTSPDGNVLRLRSSPSGVDLDRDAAERLITALAEHFRIPQIVICGEPQPGTLTPCVRWPGHEGQHAGRGDRSNTHPTWVLWGGSQPKNRPTCGGGVLGQCDRIPGHDGRHNTPLCGEGFTDALSRTQVCDVVAGHIGGHQRLGVRFDQSEPDTEPEVSVQDRIQKEHAVDRAHYTALEDLLKDAFRQRSSLHTGMLAQHTATHEMLRGLLTEIRDRLPEPPPPQCSDQSPTPGVTCERVKGHEGRHGYNISSWPQECRGTSPYGGADCVLSWGHLGNHSNGLQAWLQA